MKANCCHFPCLQNVVAEAKAQQADAAEKLAMIDAKVSQVSALKAQ